MSAPAALARLERLDSQRRGTLRAGIDGALTLLRDPAATPAQREARAETYLQCVHAQLREIDERRWALFTRSAS